MQIGRPNENESSAAKTAAFWRLLWEKKKVCFALIEKALSIF